MTHDIKVKCEICGNELYKHPAEVKRQRRRARKYGKKAFVCSRCQIEEHTRIVIEAHKNGVVGDPIIVRASRKW